MCAPSITVRRHCVRYPGCRRPAILCVWCGGERIGRVGVPALLVPSTWPDAQRPATSHLTPYRGQAIIPLAGVETGDMTIRKMTLVGLVVGFLASSYGQCLLAFHQPILQGFFIARRLASAVPRTYQAASLCRRGRKAAMPRRAYEGGPVNAIPDWQTRKQESAEALPTGSRGRHGVPGW